MRLPALAARLPPRPRALPTRSSAAVDCLARRAGFVISIYCLGALVGCNSSSQLADRWGRKTFLLWNSMIFVIGGLLEAAAILPECALTGGWQARQPGFVSGAHDAVCQHVVRVSPLTLCACVSLLV